MAKKKNNADVIEPKSSTHSFKNIAAAQKHVTAFLNALSGDEKFNLELFSTADGISCSCNTSGTVK